MYSRQSPAPERLYTLYTVRHDAAIRVYINILPYKVMKLLYAENGPQKRTRTGGRKINGFAYYIV